MPTGSSHLRSRFSPGRHRQGRAPRYIGSWRRLRFLPWQAIVAIVVVLVAAVLPAVAELQIRLLAASGSPAAAAVLKVPLGLAFFAALLATGVVLFSERPRGEGLRAYLARLIRRVGELQLHQDAEERRRHRHTSQGVEP